MERLAMLHPTNPKDPGTRLALAETVQRTMIGIALREQREEAGLTRGELEVRSGISAATLAAIEAGTSEELTMRNLILITEALGLEFDIVFREV